LGYVGKYLDQTLFSFHIILNSSLRYSLFGLEGMDRRVKPESARIRWRDFKLSLLTDQVLMKVIKLFGKEAVSIVQVLERVEEITETEIADQTQIPLNLVRKTLYRLYDHSLVGLRQTRDPKTGWFVYHWRFQPDQVENFIFNRKRRVLEKLETRLRYEKSHEFYSCKTPWCKRFTFEEAFDLLFKCPTCNKPMVHITNDQIVETLTRKISQIKKELSE